MVCTDGIATFMCLFVPLAVNSLASYWMKFCVHVMFVYADIIGMDVFLSLLPFYCITTSSFL